MVNYLLIAEIARISREIHEEHERHVKRLFDSCRMPRLCKGPLDTEVTPMTYDQEQRAINLADAAGRAVNNGQTALAQLLADRAEKLLLEGAGQSFLSYGLELGLNMDLLLSPGGTLGAEKKRYASEQTQELFDCWLAARGQKVWTPEANRP